MTKLPTKKKTLDVLTVGGKLPKQLVSAHLYSLFRSNIESTGGSVQESITTAVYMALVVFRDAEPEIAQRYAIAVSFAVYEKVQKNWNQKATKKHTSETLQFTEFSGVIVTALHAFDTKTLEKE